MGICRKAFIMASNVQYTHQEQLQQQHQQKQKGLLDVVVVVVVTLAAAAAAAAPRDPAEEEGAGLPALRMTSAAAERAVLPLPPLLPFSPLTRDTTPSLSDGLATLELEP